jgi:Antitoxin VbhA
MTDNRPMISPEEMQRRRVHVRVAISENRLEGIATSAATLEICEAYIRGEIQAADLVTAYRKRDRKRGAHPDFEPF